MRRRLHRHRTVRSSPRHGAAALFVLICLSFATVVTTLLMKAGLAERTYTSRLELTHQADWLVEAGVDRAAAQLARSADYADETWPISAARLDGSRTAVVHIEINRDADPEDAPDPRDGRTPRRRGTTVEATKEVRVTALAPKDSRGNNR